MQRLIELPHDLVDDIIWELRNDFAFLQPCSVISHPFLPPIRRRLFSTVSLEHPPDVQRPCQRLYDVLSQSPHLITHIRELHDKEVEWILDEETFPLLFQRITNGGVPQVFSLKGFLDAYILWGDNGCNSFFLCVSRHKMADAC